MQRLANATLHEAAPDVARFPYDRAALRPRIVHLGLGAFFRAHGALYTDDVLCGPGSDWGIVGASLRRPDQRDRLKPQDGLYTTTEIGPGEAATRIVGCLLDAMVAPEDPGALVRRLSDRDTAIVTLTVTEKGYCHDPASGRLDPSHPDIVHDLAHPEAPRSAIGFIAAGLARRRRDGIRPFTVATCDNLPGNGALLAGLVRDFAALRDDGLAAWIESAVPFPSSMVDRIVPAEAAGDADRVARRLGLRDAGPVFHEPFRQWVIEDRFVDGSRPAWETAGVEFVEDVAPFEHAKLRMLNGSHSSLAYLGYLAGHETIGDTVADGPFSAFAQRLWTREIVPTLAEPPGMDLGSYARTLLERYRNATIRHRTWQIAMDGSQKLPQRLLGTIRDDLRAGRPIPCLALAVAAWIRYVGAVDESGAPIDVRDPMAPVLKQRLDTAGADPADRVRAVLSLEAVFGTDLARIDAFVSAVTGAYLRLLEVGARACVRELAEA